MEEIQRRVHAAVSKNAEREATLKKMFKDAGCVNENLEEEHVSHERLPNVVCRLPGSNDATVIIGAHFDHVEQGMGVIDNWSGACLLPSLYDGLKRPDAPHKHTFIFVGFTDEESGLVGSSFYVSHLTRDESSQVRAMINLDSLGLGPTEVWVTHSNPGLLRALIELAQEMHLSVGFVNADRIASEDSVPFAKRKIPTLMIHSITPDTLPILHSPQDTFSALRMNDYYDTYRLLSAYLSFIDGALN